MFLFGMRCADGWFAFAALLAFTKSWGEETHARKGSDTSNIPQELGRGDTRTPRPALPVGLLRDSSAESWHGWQDGKHRTAFKTFKTFTTGKHIAHTPHMLSEAHARMRPRAFDVVQDMGSMTVRASMESFSFRVDDER